MTLGEFQAERTSIISAMLDNPDEYGIYPTTICFESLDKLFVKLTSKPVESPEPTTNTGSPKLLDWEKIRNQVNDNPSIIEGSDFGRCSVSLVICVVQDIVDQQLRAGA